MSDFRQSFEKSSFPRQRESIALTLDTRLRGNAIKLRIPPFDASTNSATARGLGGLKWLKYKIPLSPPFSKGEVKSLNLMILPLTPV